MACGLPPKGAWLVLGELIHCGIGLNLLLRALPVGATTQYGVDASDWSQDK
jgi:hypothetical protein